MTDLTDTLVHTPGRLRKGLLLDEAQSDVISVKFSPQTSLAALHAVLPA